jgi:hypothetical protein
MPALAGYTGMKSANLSSKRFGCRSSLGGNASSAVDPSSVGNLKIKRMGALAAPTRRRRTDHRQSIFPLRRLAVVLTLIMRHLVYKRSVVARRCLTSHIAARHSMSIIYSC